MWRYGGGHAQLLLRSVKADSNASRIEVLFKAVKTIDLTSSCDGLCLRREGDLCLAPSTVIGAGRATGDLDARATFRSCSISRGASASALPTSTSRDSSRRTVGVGPLVGASIPAVGGIQPGPLLYREIGDRELAPGRQGGGDSSTEHRVVVTGSTRHLSCGPHVGAALRSDASAVPIDDATHGLLQGGQAFFPQPLMVAERAQHPSPVHGVELADPPVGARLSRRQRRDGRGRGPRPRARWDPDPRRTGQAHTSRRRFEPLPAGRRRARGSSRTAR